MTKEQRNKLRELCERAQDLRPLDNYPGYAVSSDGIVWSIGSNWRGYGVRPITAFKDKYGYFKVRLSVSGSRLKKSVHRLICEAFHGPRPSKLHEVRHLDGVRTNNISTNLKWSTRSENAMDRKLHGTERAAENGRKSAHKLKKNYCKYGHPRTKDNLYLKGQCKLCRYAHYKQLKKARQTLKELGEE